MQPEQTRRRTDALDIRRYMNIDPQKVTDSIAKELIDDGYTVSLSQDGEYVLIRPNQYEEARKELIGLLDAWTSKWMTRDYVRAPYRCEVVR